jgi:hypothetical protein
MYTDCSFYTTSSHIINLNISYLFVLEQVNANAKYPDNIIFGDKAIFHTGGIVSCQNGIIWDNENSQYKKDIVNSSKVNVCPSNK